MGLRGGTVKHKMFGKGKILECASNRVTILFGGKTKKKFLYPSAFGRFLEIEDKSFLKQIEEDKNVFAQEKAKEKQLIIERRAQMRTTQAKLRASSSRGARKAPDRSNVAFKCNYCDGGKNTKAVGFKGLCSDEMINYNVSKAKNLWCSSPESQCYKYWQGDITRQELDAIYNDGGLICYESQMLKSWRAYAGIIQSGRNKGKSIRMSSVRPHSLALLTTRLPNVKDDERFIFAVFLVDENTGSNWDEGYVEAGPKYRMVLSPDEARQLKFWDYSYNPKKPTRNVFGSGLHRYLTDEQAAQVLKAIYEIKRSTGEEKKAKDFLDFYCKIKGINAANIHLPNGANE